jgi:hypothetical protein
MIFLVFCPPFYLSKKFWNSEILKFLPLTKIHSCLKNTQLSPQWENILDFSPRSYNPLYCYILLYCFIESGKWTFVFISRLLYVISIYWALKRETTKIDFRSTFMFRLGFWTIFSYWKYSFLFIFISLLILYNKFSFIKWTLTFHLTSISYANVKSIFLHFLL